MPVVLGQAVGNGEPRRLGPDENMLGRTDGRAVDERSHGDVNKGAGTNHGKEQRTACLAMRIIPVCLAVSQRADYRI